MSKEGSPVASEYGELDPEKEKRVNKLLERLGRFTEDEASLNELIRLLDDSSITSKEKLDREALVNMVSELEEKEANLENVKKAIDNITMPVFDGSGYSNYVDLMEMYLQSRGLWNVTTQPPPPLLDRSSYWVKWNLAAATIILSTLGKTQLTMVKPVKHFAYEIWRKLKLVHGQSTNLTHNNLLDKLHDFKKKPGQSIPEYVSDFQELAIDLKDRNVQVGEKVLIHRFLANIPDTYEIDKKLLMKEKELNLELAINTILGAYYAHEYADKARDLTPNEAAAFTSSSEAPVLVPINTIRDLLPEPVTEEAMNKAMALVMSRGGMVVSPHQRPPQRCYGCGQLGHIKKFCPTHKDKNPPGKFCFVCGSDEHMANRCAERKTTKTIKHEGEN